MITGINHLTLAVKDLAASFRFYADVLGFQPVARWSKGAYLAAGTCWLALASDSSTRSGPLPGETHVAFDVASRDFPELVRRLRAAGVGVWRENRSEGASLYFLDPDGHKLEVHVGSLQSRMAALETSPPPGLTVYRSDHAEHDDAAESSRPSAQVRYQDFPKESLRRKDLAADPLTQFASWLDQAVRGTDGDPYAMTLSTVRSDGVPSARTVALKKVNAQGFIFTSRYDGPKGRELSANPQAALVFYWPAQGRQVRAMGTVARLSKEESARYFHARPRESQLLLWIFSQSEPVSNRAALEKRFEALAQEHEGKDVPIPAWGGYVVRPHAAEFWQGRSNRLHDRFRYHRSDGGDWVLQRLAP